MTGCAHPDGLTLRGSPGDEWIECWLCGQQITVHALEDVIDELAEK